MPSLPDTLAQITENKVKSRLEKIPFDPGAQMQPRFHQRKLDALDQFFRLSFELRVGALARHHLSFEVIGNGISTPPGFDITSCPCCKISVTVSTLSSRWRHLRRI